MSDTSLYMFMTENSLECRIAVFHQSFDQEHVSDTSSIGITGFSSDGNKFWDLKLNLSLQKVFFSFWAEIVVLVLCRLFCFSGIKAYGCV
jgi:hypothetical protein